MIEIKDVLIEIDRTLRVLFPNIKKVHLERINKLISPALSIEIIGYKTPVIDQHIVNKKLSIEIVYFAKENSVKEALLVQEKLTRAFALGLKVKDRFLHIDEECESKLIEQDLHFLMDFDFLDELKPTIATKNKNESIFDTGDTSIENIVNEIEIKETDETIFIDSDKKVLTNDLVYMETLHLDYEL